MDLTKEQLDELTGVFRAEAVEHVKGLAGALLTLESENPTEHEKLLTIAFRFAHSLKGSSATLGFERVELMTHRLEDVLGALRRKDLPMDAHVVDLLLETLDAIRRAVDNSQPGDGSLTPEEQDRVTQLEALAHQARSMVAPTPLPLPKQSPPPLKEKAQEPSPRDYGDEAPSMGAYRDFQPEQLAHLSAVFRTEAQEHLRGLAEAFLNLEESNFANLDELLGEAFRHAHSLKGSAGTLGFARVAAMSRRLEDVLTLLRHGKIKMQEGSPDMLLRALDTIRISVDSSSPGDGQCTPTEDDVIRALEALIADKALKPIAADKPDHWTGEGGGGALADIPAEQVAQLAGVFRIEAVDHIRGIAAALLTLEDNPHSAEAEELLSTAFRHAHSLKGSAGTLGFERVALVTHRLEDTLGLLRRGTGFIDGEKIDLLLTTLDSIRRGVDTAVPGDARLTAEEQELVKRLECVVSTVAPSLSPKGPARVEAAAQESNDDRPCEDEAEPQAGGAFGDIPQEQLEQISAVFRAEAQEHLRQLTDSFLAMDEGSASADFEEVLSRAFRNAHSLKGSAATLGFDRVSTVTHRIEDVLGLLRRKERAKSPELVDLLLSTLDVVRRAVETSRAGDAKLTGEERECVRRLKDVVETSSTAESAPRSGPARAQRPVHSVLPQDQLAKLAEIFRMEAIEHIKILAQTFFSMEENPGGNHGEMLTNAFRAAHSLKGSASTLGFDGIATIGHKLEDVLDALRGQRLKVERPVIDALLRALDAIRQTVTTPETLASELSASDEQIAKELEKLASGSPKAAAIAVDTASAPSSPTPASPKPGSAAVAPVRQEPAKPQSPAPASPPPSNGGAGGARGGEVAQQQETFIRIAESKVDSVIALVGELFEANLQIEAVEGDLRLSLQSSMELAEMLGALQWQLQGTGYEEELYPLSERAQSLSIHLRTSAKKFEQDERNLAKLIGSAQEELRKIRLAPVSTIFVTIRRQVREVAKVTGRKVELYLGGGEYAVDRKVLEAIEDPMVHSLRNAIDHGIEPPEERRAAGKPEVGRVSVVARHTGDAVELTIADDGRGIDPEKVREALIDRKRLTTEQAANLTGDQILDYLFESGFSTHKGVTQVSGRGVGLDVVKFTVERLGGEVRLESRLGEGTAITMRLPLAMSTVRCLLVRVAGRMMAVPASNVEKVIVPTREMLKYVGGAEVIEFDGQNVPMGSLAELLELSSGVAEFSQDSRVVIMVRFGERRFAFVIEELVEYTQLILKPLGDLLERVPNISGLSVLGTGELTLVLNPADLVRNAGGVRREAVRPIFTAPEVETADVTTILVVDDSIATRTLEKTLLESAGFNVLTASDGYKALDVLATHRVHLVLSDVQMPNMGGIELTRTIKSRPNMQHLPVVLVTSLGSDEDKSHGMAAGADAYIVKKELTQSELINTINQLL
ncbi:MAG: Hpt domain-containing protein [Myxococcota bacterium]|jgi:two-component system chemotaxis sensor kinase CheA|nr:Hpt domain-containing protein [Myxococcota bacterium]